MLNSFIFEGVVTEVSPTAKGQITYFILSSTPSEMMKAKGHKPANIVCATETGSELILLGRRIRLVGYIQTTESNSTLFMADAVSPCHD